MRRDYEYVEKRVMRMSVNVRRRKGRPKHYVDGQCKCGLEVDSRILNSRNLARMSL